MRTLSLASAAVHVALLGVTAFFALGLALAPFENQSPESEATQDWLLVLAPLLAVLAIAFARAAVARNVKVMAAAWVIEFLLTAAALFYTLGLDSEPDAYVKLIAGTLLILATSGVATVTVHERT